jgi:hypothetical protein
VERAVVSTDSEHVATLCQEAGFDVPFIRPAALANPEASAPHVLHHAVEWLGAHEEYLPEWILVLFVTYPFRSRGLIDSFIETVLSRELDSAIAVLPERHPHWMLDPDQAPYLVTYGSETAKSHKQTVYRELFGLMSMAKREVILGRSLYGKRLGVIPIDDVFAPVCIHDLKGWQLAELLAPRFLEIISSNSTQNAERS